MSSGINNLRISVKIMLGHAAVLIVLLVFVSLLTALGMSYTFFHQAERELGISAERVTERLQSMGAELEQVNAGTDRYPRFMVGMFRDKAVVPGVIVQVHDLTAGSVYGSRNLMPVAEMTGASSFMKTLYKTLFDGSRMKLYSYNNFTIGCEEVLAEKDGHRYRLQFLRVITAETSFLRSLGYALLFANVLGIMLALLAGYFISRRTLQPIRTITQAAQELEVSDLSRRLEVPQVKDELSELMETFNRMLDRVQTGFEQQRRFVSDASHELRTPVTVIRGYSDMLARWGRDDPETMNECVSAIRSETEDMQELIEKLLFLARADQKRQVLHKERLDLQELVGDIAKKAKLVATEHSFLLEENDEGFACLDAVLFKQMLRVFIENSLKYTPKGGHITLSSRRQGQVMLVSVADDGQGIPKEHQAHVFERFYRVDSSRTKSDGGPGGSGLGMAIASWIASEHDIGIELKSEVGKGTRITLSVPLV